jgi:hypothetical protein
MSEYPMNSYVRGAVWSIDIKKWRLPSIHHLPALIYDTAFLEETRLETWFGETGLKIGPDVFCHDNCEQIIKTKLTYLGYIMCVWHTFFIAFLYNVSLLKYFL